MGQTYYYYVCAHQPETGIAELTVHKYELDDGTEIHDPTVPSTTTCPYLPGQPVNLLWVPVEIQMPRERSASMSLMSRENIKTMVPEDKFLTPRAPPPVPPKRARSNTAPMSIARRRPARSTSPGTERPQWSPKMLFRRRSPSSPTQKDKRGRWSPLGRFFGDDANGSPPSPAKWLHEMRHSSAQTTRTTSTKSISRPVSHEIPLRLAISQGPPTLAHPTFPLPMPDGIEEEIEDDDDNFANQLKSITLSEDNQPISTPLSPPSLYRRSTSRHSSFNTSKPLPDLPKDPALSKDPAISLPPMHPLIRSAHLPRSHFSASTAVTSPTASYFDFSDDEDDDPDADDESDDEDLFIDSPVVEPASPRSYKIRDAAAAEQHAMIRKHAVEALAQVGSRTTFGGPSPPPPGARSVGMLEELRSELGYLGEMIVSE